MNTVVRQKSINILETSQIFFNWYIQNHSILRTILAIPLTFQLNKWLNHKDVSVHSQVLEGKRRDTVVSHLFKILTER